MAERATEIEVPTPEINPDDLITELDALLSEADAVGLAPSQTPTPDVAASPSQPPTTASNFDDSIQTDLRKRILIVEDNPDYREVVSYLLRQNGFEVIEAAEGSSGLSAALGQAPDLVLLDFHMPRMNGYEMLKELRTNPETRGMPVIMFSGGLNRSKIRNSVDELCDFLEKPVSNERLLQAVSLALSRGQLTTSTETPAPAPQIPSPSDEDLFDQSLSEESGFSLNEIYKDRAEDADAAALANDFPLINRINQIMARAVELGASDIHIEPLERETSIRVRINGSLQPIGRLPSHIHARLVARVKIMSNLVITERRLPQDGQIRAMIKGQKTEFRVSTLPSLHGEKIVMRVLGAGNIKASLSELGFYPRDLACVEQALQNPHGLILVTGPTGSGKSTTLYTMLRSISKPDVHVLTAEDPIEYELPGITQVAVMPKIGLSFEATLRAFLRQDPDVMLVGEIRDTETAEIAVKASITGHLVLSTLHTNSSAATITRLINMGVAPYLVESSIKLVVAQRLVKILCHQCKVPMPLSEREKNMLNGWESEVLTQVFKGMGCKSCRQTGFSGRIPLFEVMPVNTQEMRRRIMRNESPDSLFELAKTEGMTSLRQAAMNVVASGQTSLDEAFRVMMGE